MFFSAYLGGSRGLDSWRRIVTRHAQWLGLTCQVERPELSSEAHVGLAWLEHESRRNEQHTVRTDEILAVRTYGAATEKDIIRPGNSTWETLASTPDANAVRLSISLRDGEVAVVVPPTTPQQIYFTRTADGWILADDLRVFGYVGDFALDARAVYTLLQFSAIPPTLTLYHGVQRVPNGHFMRVRADASEVAYTPFFRPAESRQLVRGERDAEQRIQESLDAILAPLPNSAVLYFSGGVDSGLIAARLARLGRQDIRLVNYAFDAADEEHQLAVRMASHFGFRCELVPQLAAQAAEVLSRAGRDYSFPFGDISTIPTNALVHGSLPWASEAGTVIEGTGADGAYGLAAAYPRWRRTYQLPRLIRRQIGNGYRWLELWKGDTRLERIGRFVRKSAELSLPHAVIAQNALEGIAYDSPTEEPSLTALAASESLDAVAAGTPPLDRLSLLDLMWVCAGRMAPKAFDPLRLRGIRTVYPFLEPSMVSLSAALPWETKCVGGQAKGILKRMLARDVPAEWVYRRKTGFTRAASANAVFASQPVQEILHDVVLSSSNPLRDFCRVDLVRRLVERTRHDSVSVGVHIFLWTLAFTSMWLRGRPPR